MAPDPKHVNDAQSRLGQLLGETLIHAHPWLSEITEETRQRFMNAWIEGLEQHTTGLIGDLVARISAEGDPPPELAKLLAAAGDPTAQFGGILQQLFVYGVMFQLAGTMLAPFTQQVANNIWEAHPDRPLTPADIATAAGRGINLGDKSTVPMQDWMYQEAARNGADREQIDLMASLVGLPPALQELFELYRRGDINEAEVKQGLKEGDFKDSWVERTMGLTHAWLTPLDFVRAAVQTQMPYADAREWAHKTGLKVDTALPIETAGPEVTADMFGLAFSISGRPPGPVQLGEMALRGIIPWEGKGAAATTFEQGIAESDVKTKWTDKLRELMTYVPPPAEIGTMLEHGAITEQQAERLWSERGIPPEIVKAYVYRASQEHVRQDKLLAAGEVKTGYYDGIFTREQALRLLGDVGIREAVADETLQIIDFRREIQSINGVIKRVETLYAAHKLTAARAKDAMLEVGLSAGRADDLLATWESLRTQPIHLPNAREIGMAVRYGTITGEQGQQKLEDLGYQPEDAAIILTAYSHEAITPLPPPGSTITG